MKRIVEFLTIGIFMLSCAVLPTMAQNTFPANGKVGIGTSNPIVGLQMGETNANIEMKQIMIPGVYNFERMTLGQFGNGNAGLEIVNHNNTLNSYGVRLLASVDFGGPGMQFQYAASKDNYNALEYKTGLFMAADGRIGIGTLSPKESLSVNGKIRAHEIKVETANWPDYVFEENYKGISLKELGRYIKVNKHLPEMPSAEKAEKEGVDLGEMNKLLLKKIEELTLHVIELDRKLDQQTKLNKAASKRTNLRK